MKRETTKTGLRLWPQNVSKWVWYYEGPRGIEVIVQPRDAKGTLLFAMPAFTIPWRKVGGSVDRYRRGKAKR